jgi:NAD(P)-dependent dehydrogenase (short-subunit alcohol dehydrogenase family)
MMLRDKLVVIAGGAGTLGRLFARRVAERGGRAVVADSDAVSAAHVAEQIAADHPGLVESAALDVTDGRSIGALISHLGGRHGRIDAVVNSAYPRNRNYGRKLEEVTYADFCENVNLHLGGYFLVAQQFGLFFRKQGGGNIINMSSIYGVTAPRFEIYAGTSMTMPVEYAAIKAAIIHLTRYFAQYFKGTGIRVNCLSPGGILEDQPADFIRAYKAHCNSKGMLDPADVAGALLFLLSDDSKSVTGQNLIVDDGWTL